MFSLQDLLSEALKYRLLTLIIVVLCVLALHFLFRFCIPALAVLRSLTRIYQALRAPGTRAAQQRGNDLSAMIGAAAEEPAFATLWKQYAKTLHPRRVVDDQGQQRIAGWRATALAETVFTEQALVDSPLRTEYFKHLPGILTGVGIIGTFRGLIQ